MLAVLVVFGFAVASTALYAAWDLFMFLTLWRAGRFGGPRGLRPAPPTLVRESELPAVTILLPLYREERTLPHLLASVHRFDYPKDHIDAKLLLEEDDQITWRAVARLHGTRHDNVQFELLPQGLLVRDNEGREGTLVVDLVDVPRGTPKTKPRALNFGLKWARGDLVTIYDAEDRPERDQLKKVAAYFRAYPDPSLACVQCRLNYYNPDQSLLTRLFTIEYTMWFDSFLPAWERAGNVVLLGGTSNFFRTDILRRVGGWNPYNVTEDADLGVRLARAHYRTAVIDSTTWEEAVPRLRPWIRQRSRWLKGYMQTARDHLRRPVAMVREVGPWKTLSVAILTLSPFLNFPVLATWSLFVIYWVNWLRPGPLAPVAETIRAGYNHSLLVYYASMGTFAAGILLTWMLSITTIAARASRLKDPEKAGSMWAKMKFAYLLPLYYFLFFFPTCIAAYELVVRPNFWHKTTHGVSLPDTTEAVP